MVFATGDWTDDTDQLLLILQSLLEAGGRADPSNFGAKLSAWMENGFAELGDQGGAGLGRTTKNVLTHPDFARDPHAAARAVWEGGSRRAAPNGAVMRTAVTGIPAFWDPETVEANTLGRSHQAVLSLCVACCLVVVSTSSWWCRAAPHSTMPTRAR
jgi:ADP-ribosylglycohydrolase